MKYKVTYLHHLMAMAFVRIADELIIYCNENEMYVRVFAEGYCSAKGERLFIE